MSEPDLRRAGVLLASFTLMVACAPSTPGSSHPVPVVSVASAGSAAAPESSSDPAGEKAPPAPSRLPSCDDAARHYGGSDGDPDGGPSAARYASIINRGTYLAVCRTPATTEVSICCAVQNGQVVGLTVRTDPADAELENCIAREVRVLQFPSHPTLDVTRMNFL